MRKSSDIYDCLFSVIFQRIDVVGSHVPSLSELSLLIYIDTREWSELKFLSVTASRNSPLAVFALANYCFESEKARIYTPQEYRSMTSSLSSLSIESEKGVYTVCIPHLGES